MKKSYYAEEFNVIFDRFEETSYADLYLSYS